MSKLPPNPFKPGAKVLVCFGSHRDNDSWRTATVDRAYESGRFTLTGRSMTGKDRQQYRSEHGNTSGWTGTPTGERGNLRITVYPNTAPHRAKMKADEHKTELENRRFQVVEILQKHRRTISEELLADLEAALTKAKLLP